MGADRNKPHIALFPLNHRQTVSCWRAKATLLMFAFPPLERISRNEAALQLVLSELDRRYATLAPTSLTYRHIIAAYGEMGRLEEVAPLLGRGEGRGFARLWARARPFISQCLLLHSAGSQDLQGDAGGRDRSGCGRLQRPPGGGGPGMPRSSDEVKTPGEGGGGGGGRAEGLCALPAAAGRRPPTTARHCDLQHPP